MKNIRLILLSLLCLGLGAPTERAAAQYDDVTIDIDWGDSWAEPAQMISPANGSTLASSTVVFQWTTGNLVEQYWLRIGTTFGGKELVEQSMGLATSATVSLLPINGRPIYVTLFSKVDEDWPSYTYTYATASKAGTSGTAGQVAAARMASPPDGSTLPAGSATFQWTPVAGAQQYWLYVGTSRDGYELFNNSMGSATSVVVPNLPRTGQPIFVKLWTNAPDKWLTSYHQYIAASQNSGTSTSTGTGGTGFDRMLRFDGVDDYVLIPMDVSETSYTVSIWFRTTSPDGGIFSATDASGGGHDRHIYLSKGNLCSRVWADETIATEGQNYADSKWHQVTHVFGGSMGGQKLFVDGEQRQFGHLAQSAFHGQSHLRIGYSADGGHFRGEVYDVRLWGVALSASEIAAQVRQVPDLNYPSLQGYWTFDEASDSQEVLNSAPRFRSVKGTFGENLQVDSHDPQRIIYQ